MHDPASARPTRPAPASPARARRSLGRKLALVVAGLLFSALLAELALRVWGAFAHPAMYVLDDELGWRPAAGVARTLPDENGRPVAFATDARGLRATPFADARPAGTMRVLVAGDSFTQGSQVEADELFTTRLGGALAGVEVFNAGVGGYSTLQQLRALRPQLARYTPDLVVLAVFENDFQDNLMPYFSGLGPRPHLRVAAGGVELVERPDPAPFGRFLLPVPGAWWWYRHCALYRTLHKNLFLPRHAVRLAELEHAERAALTASDQRAAMAWALSEVAHAVRTAQAGVLIAAIPARDQVEAGAAASHDWLGARCRELGVPFVSLLPALHDAGAALAYFAHDIHLTAAGHAAVAAALAPAVRAALAPR